MEYTFAAPEHGRSWYFLLLDQPFGNQRLGQLAREPHAGHDALQVVAVGVVALVEILEVDRWRGQWVGAAKRDLTGGVVGVRFQHHPGQAIGVLRQQ